MAEIKNAINWFEIPVANMDRAVKFYSDIFGSKFTAIDAQENAKMAFFPAQQGGVSGALVQSKGYTPAETGTLVYLSAGADLNTVLNKVESAGGKILQKKFSIREHGHIAYFKDSEGNKVALHSMN